MRTAHYEFASPGGIRGCIAALKPRTAIIDIEPLIAYWDTGVEALDQGLNAYAVDLSQLPSLECIAFATNSFRRPAGLPSNPGISITYHTRAMKPLHIEPFRQLPNPGVVIGDQIATDGVLAYRLGYTFIRYRVPPDATKLGPKLMAGLGTLLRPVFLPRPGT